MGRRQKENKLSVAQRNVVRQGVQFGLTKEQIDLYVNPAFSPAQMQEILQGHLDGLEMSEIKVYADPLVHVDEMRRIRHIYQLAKQIDQGQKELAQMVQCAEQRAHPLVHATLFRRDQSR